MYNLVCFSDNFNSIWSFSLVAKNIGLEIWRLLGWTSQAYIDFSSTCLFAMVTLHGNICAIAHQMGTLCILMAILSLTFILLEQFLSFKMTSIYWHWSTQSGVISEILLETVVIFLICCCLFSPLSTYFITYCYFIFTSILKLKHNIHYSLNQIL